MQQPSCIFLYSLLHKPYNGFLFKESKTELKITLSIGLLFQMVLRQDQAHRGREEAADAAERARRVPHQRLRVPAQRLLALGPRRRHGQALPHPAARRRRLLHRQEDDVPDAAGAGRPLQSRR